MQKILLIIQNEYLKRVKKKSFILMTLLTPLLMASIYLIPIFLANQKDELKIVQIIDESGLIASKLTDDEEIDFVQISKKLDAAKADFKKDKAHALVYIPQNIVDAPNSMQVFSEKSVSMFLKGKLEKTVSSEIRDIKLKNQGIDSKLIESAEVKVDANTYSLSDGEQKQNSSEAATVVGYALAFILYIVLLVYGSQVMRGVMEEKSSRIVEVMISSVKPFQLMIGKIVGVAMVGLTQFLLWIMLTWAISAFTGKFFLQDRLESMQNIEKTIDKDPTKAIEQQKQQADVFYKVKTALDTLPVGTILITFMFYFIGGYLLYSSLFAAIGAAVDNEADTQQFMFPVMLPIIVAIMLSTATIKDPDGTVAFWASMVPFTSPVNMMVRIPFGVPVWQIVLSISILIVSFVCTTWLAARIYRVGILMYGKKVTFKELWKWMFYKA